MKWPDIKNLKWTEAVSVASTVAAAVLVAVNFAYSKGDEVLGRVESEIQASETRQNLRRDEILRHYVPTEDWLRWQRDNSARLDRNEFTMEKNFLILMNRLDAIQNEVRRR